jgi:hypothetical protein
MTSVPTGSAFSLVFSPLSTLFSTSEQESFFLLVTVIFASLILSFSSYVSEGVAGSSMLIEDPANPSHVFALALFLLLCSPLKIHVSFFPLAIKRPTLLKLTNFTTIYYV